MYIFILNLNIIVIIYLYKKKYLNYYSKLLY